MANDELTRKSFLKIAVGAVAATALGGAAGALVIGEAQAGEAAPADGRRRRWGMVIDSTKCESGCTACIDACHQTHNVPNIGNPKEEVKWVWKEEYEHVFGDVSSRLSEEKRRLPMLTLCNHCERPPCVRACPTQATFKRGDGIVQMDFHRCIGCRFCMAACPYGSRSFNFKDPEPHIAKVNPQFPHRTRGVVEKCNMCAERIDRGLEPLCATVCPSKAITFGDLNDPASEVHHLVEARELKQRKPELGTEPSIYYIT